MSQAGATRLDGRMNAAPHRSARSERGRGPPVRGRGLRRRGPVGSARPNTGRRPADASGECSCPRPTAVRARQPPCCSQRARASGCAPRVPKVLHPIAGRHAARARRSARSPRSRPSTSPSSSGTRASRSSPRSRRSASRLGLPLATAVQEQQLGTGHAVRCGLEALPSGLTGAVVVTYGDVPLLEAGHAAGAARRTRRGAARPSRCSPPSSPTPPVTGGCCAGRTARSPAIVEQADATAEQRAVREINSGVYASTPRSSPPAWPGWRATTRRASCT